MGKRLAFLVMGAHGHVNPTLALAEELTRRGHAVDYWTTEAFRGAVEAAGVRFRGFDSLLMKLERPKGLDPAAMLRMMPGRFLGEMRHVLPQLEGPFRDERPDLLLYDNMALAGRVLAESLGLRAGVLFTSYAGNERFNVMRAFGSLPEETQREYDEIMGSVTARYGTKPFAFTDMATHGEDLSLVFMPRLWQPEGSSFDQRYEFVGPCLGTRAPSESLPLDDLAPGPLLFISLGTAFNDNPAFYRTCLEAFGGTPWKVVMAIGARSDPAALGPVPANVVVRPHVPQLAVLEHATVFLTHGGMNSTMEGLASGVPLVALPQMAEQAVTARRIAEMGVGLSLDGVELSVDSLRAAVERAATDQAMRERIVPIQKAIAEAGGARRAGDAVEAFLAKSGAEAAPRRPASRPRDAETGPA